MNNENTSKNLSFNYKETLNAVTISSVILMFLSFSKVIGHKKDPIMSLFLFDIRILSNMRYKKHRI